MSIDNDKPVLADDVVFAGWAKPFSKQTALPLSYLIMRTQTHLYPAEILAAMDVLIEYGVNAAKLRQIVVKRKRGRPRKASIAAPFDCIEYIKQVNEYRTDKEAIEDYCRTHAQLRGISQIKNLPKKIQSLQTRLVQFRNARSQGKK